MLLPSFEVLFVLLPELFDPLKERLRIVLILLLDRHEQLLQRLKLLRMLGYLLLSMRMNRVGDVLGYLVPGCFAHLCELEIVHLFELLAAHALLKLDCLALPCQHGHQKASVE